tara:strand:- start:5542 stop:6726 length:1185 start_codon:yes stop_codon:yes gene_type:complete
VETIMAASLVFFPVANGDMTLITLDNGQTILIDIKIRAAADDEDDDTYDVASDLKDRLKTDSEGRPFVDSFLLSHPDQDHITGLENHFYLGLPADYPKDSGLIFIREMWSSPLVFRRASTQHVLCEDAKAWDKEARRRVQRFKDDNFGTVDGDRILIMGKDKDGKTDEIMDIVVEQGGLISSANRGSTGQFTGRLLAPMLVAEDDELVALLEKNNSSVIINFSLTGGGNADRCRYLTGGDAGVAIWERLWQNHKDSDPDWFTYDLMQAPHHCSWRTLSYDRWSEMGEKVKVCEDARSALGQAKFGATIVASCKPILKDDSDPPHERAKREYVSILKPDTVKGEFICTSEYTNANDRPLEFTVTFSGVSKKLRAAAAAATTVGVSAVASSARGHG